jgi:Holliday junction resolvase
MAKRVDGNHAEIVEALRVYGCAVQSLAAVGHGVPDLLVARNGRWYVMEVKDGSKPPSARKLTPDEAAWHERFGRHAVVSVVETVEDALAAVCAWRDMQETSP